MFMGHGCPWANHEEFHEAGSDDFPPVRWCSFQWVPELSVAIFYQWREAVGSSRPSLLPWLEFKVGGELSERRVGGMRGKGVGGRGGKRGRVS